MTRFYSHCSGMRYDSMKKRNSPLKSKNIERELIKKKNGHIRIVNVYTLVAITVVEVQKAIESKKG